MTKTRTQEIICDGCKRRKSPEKEQSLHQENHFSEDMKDDVESRDQSALNPEDRSYEADFRRAGTLNELEKGTRHARLNSPAQSHFTSLQHKSPMSPAVKKEKANLYTLGQAFFIVAGGLAIETESFREEPYLTITPTGAVELARLGLLRPIAEEVINDKTKADPITKGLVYIQAAWFIAQCISRVAHSLPLTLLEIHTLVHVLTAMSMYLFWFSKPYNALSPFIMVDPEIVQTAALFSLRDGRYESSSASIRCVLSDNSNTESVMSAHFRPSNEVGPTHDNQSSLRPREFGAEITSDRQRRDEYDLANAHQRGTEQALTPHAGPNDTLSAISNRSIDRHQNRLNTSPTSPSTFDSCLGDTIAVNSLPKSEHGVQSLGAHTRAQIQSAYPNLDARGSILERQPNRYGPSIPDTHSMTPSHHANMNLALARLGAQRLKAAKTHFTYLQSADNFIEQRSTYLVPVIADFKETPGCTLSDLNDPSRDKSSLLRLFRETLHRGIDSPWVSFLVTSYAALHLSAWNSTFPTTTERWMWRGAGLVIVAGPVLSLIPALMLLYSFNLGRKRRDAGLPCPIFENVLLRSMQLLSLLFLLMIIVAIAASRIYFLVEAFVSLRAPAPRVYETVDWTKFWPHG